MCKWEVALNPQLSFTALAIHLSIYKVYEYVQSSVTIYVQRKKLVNFFGNVKKLPLQKIIYPSEDKEVKIGKSNAACIEVT